MSTVFAQRTKPAKRCHGCVRQEGAEIVEFLVTLPVVLIVLAIVFDFGAIFADQIILTNAARSGTETPRSRTTRRTLVVAQMALTVVLLVGAALAGRSFLRLQSLDPGFRQDGVLTFSTYLMQEYGTPSARIPAALMSTSRLMPSSRIASMTRAAARKCMSSKVMPLRGYWRNSPTL